MIDASTSTLLRLRRRAACLLLQAFVLFPGALVAAENALAPGWTLSTELSKLNFQSVKNQTQVESSGFASLQGNIAPDGLATVTIQLDSVDTGIDLRNVRMRFLFFETFKFPEAVVSARLEPGMLNDLATRRRMTLPLTFDLDLHGISKPLQTDVVVTLLTDDLVSVASSTPISIGAAAFGLADGVTKLEEAASVSIIPSGSVTFDFVFRRNDPAEPAVATAAPVQAAAAAIESSGDFSADECAGRFEIISRTGAIYFASGSAELESESRPLLDSVVAIVERCPGLAIVIAGHTDSLGPDALNQTLSEARAHSVTAYLESRGVPAARLRSIGYGEDRPVAPNDSAWNRSRNRRIEFLVAEGT